jgi:hypothetical protein
MQKSWGKASTKLITGTELGGLGPWFKAAFSIGVSGNLIATKPLSLEYYLMPQIGFITGYWDAYAMLGLNSYLEASFEVLPRFSLYADAGIGLWWAPEIKDYGFYIPLGIGMKWRFEGKR